MFEKRLPCSAALARDRAILQPNALKLRHVSAHSLTTSRALESHFCAHYAIGSLSACADRGKCKQTRKRNSHSSSTELRAFYQWRLPVAARYATVDGQRSAIAALGRRGQRERRALNRSKSVVSSPAHANVQGELSRIQALCGRGRVG